MKKKITYIIYLVLVSILLPLNVFAKGTITLKVDKEDLTIGDEVLVSAVVSEDLDSYAIIATLKYDKNVFQEINDTSFFVGETKSIDYNAENNKFGIINQTGKVEEDGILFTVRLRVKENANVGDTNIALTNISSSNGKNKEEIAMTSTKVLVTRDAQEGESVPIINENEITEDEEVSIKAFNNMPIIIAFVIGATILLLVSIYLLLKMNKYQHGKKYFIISLVAEIILIGVILLLLLMNYNKKDVNKDGVKDYNDAQDIIKYLIDVESDQEKKVDKNNTNIDKENNQNKTENENENNSNADKNNTPSKPNSDYDTNNDGKVDIGDVGSVTEHVTENSKVSLENIKDDEEYYIKKGEITLKFKGEVTPKNVVIKQVKIDDEYYHVSIDEDVYLVTLPTPKEAGEYDFIITEAFLSNGAKVKTNLKITKEILKDIPYVNKFNLDDEKGTLSFELVDNDKAFEKGTYTIYDGDSVILTDEVSELTQITDIPIVEDKELVIKIIGTYDLDSDSDNNLNYYEDIEMFNHSFGLGGNYNFVLTDIGITDTIQPGQIPVVTFKSSNEKKAEINWVDLTNDEKSSSEYPISKIDEDYYEVALNNADVTPGKHTVSLDKVQLNTLKVFENTKDYEANTLNYTVLKADPKAVDIVLSDDKANKNIDVAFKLEDEDNAIQTLTVALVDSLGKIVAKQDYSAEEVSNLEVSGKTIKIALSYSNSADGFYTVKVLANYELADKYRFNNKVIGEENILTHKEDIYIKEIYVTNDKNEVTNNLYPNKNQNNYQIAVVVEVGDSINNYAKSKYSANYQSVSTITINGLNYTASQISGYKSKIYLNVPSDSGLLTIKANRVQLAINNYYKIVNDFFSVEEKTLKVEVLKDKPKIENLQIIDDYEKGEATFNFDVVLDKNVTDSEEEFKDGTIELDSQVAGIHSGKNTVTFKDIPKDTNFDLIFKGSFDLDTDNAELNSLTGDINEYEKAEIYKVSYGLYNKEDYDNITISSGTLVSEKNNQYFEKNEKIRLDFEVSGISEKLNAKVEKIVIDNKEYSVTSKENGYSLILDGYYNNGVKELKITSIILSNGKIVELKNPYIFKPEILKNVVTIGKYDYEILENEIKLAIDLKDPDKSLVKAPILKVTTETGEEIYSGEYNKNITFPKKEGILRYYITLTGDYDRDINTTTDSDNYFANVTLLNELISLEENNIELKDIIDINLYKVEKEDDDEKVVLKNEIDIEELQNNLQDYFVEVVMANMPNTRARIKNVIISNDTLVLELEYNYGSSEVKTLKINFGTVTEGIAKNEYHPEDAFRSLLNLLESNSDVKLTKNIDASVLDVNGDTYITADYKGNFDGNGYTISNLSKPLFNNITGGEVKNLKIANVTFGPSSHGALANKVQNATIKNVLVNRVTKTGSDGAGSNGGLVGSAENTIIAECGATNVTLNLGYTEQGGGLFIGHTSNNTEINNCYATGTLIGGWNYTSGFVGNSQTTTITNNFVKVEARGQTEGAAAFTDAWSNESSIYENNISIAKGTTATFTGKAKKINNNFLYRENGTDGATDGVTVITKEDINDDLFINKAHFDENLWDIHNVSYDNLPFFQYEKVSVLTDTDNEDYDENKETLYKNLLRLMPFYDSNKIIEIAKNINNELLVNEEIMHIVPVDANGNLVTYLTTDNPKNISKIKIVFKNKAKVEYDVIFDKLYDMIATYRIPSLGIDYSYNHYVINSNSQVVNNLINYLQSLDYTTNLDILTTNADSRIYRDFYNEVTKGELREFVLKFLSNSDYTNTHSDEAINNYLEREVKKDQRIEKALYVYNYFRRFYDLDVNGMKIYDFMLFNMEGFDKSLTSSKITDLYLGDGSGANFNTNETNTRYSNILGGYTNLDTVSKMLEYIVTEFSDNQMDAWVRNQFKGILVELPVANHSEVQYTLWDHFSHVDAGRNKDSYKVYNFVLPILTLPKTAAYIISGPVQFIIGAQRTYMKDPNDPVELELFMKKLNSYTTRMKSYYETAYSILEDKDLFNNMHLFQLDKRNTKNLNGTSVYNTPYSTTEPFHKNFNEVVGIWAASAGVNAGAWGDYIEWQVAGVLDSELATDGTLDIGHVTFKTWSHESAHNIDARLFLKNNGRRYDAGGEDYADDFLMQSFSENEIVMNLSIYFNKDLHIGSNLTPDRINSKAKIWDFYKKVFETIYVMDYIEAKAFLQLTPEEQKALAVQISYPNENRKFQTVDGESYDYDKYPEKFVGEFYKDDEYAKFRARQVTQYTHVSELPDFDVSLTSIDDLIDNKIMLYPGVYKYSSRGSNSYGGEGFNTVHWYQPNNPDGRPDSYALKWISYEMLGYKGYDKGFIEYASNINPVSKEVYNSLTKGLTGGTTTINTYKTDKIALERISDGLYSDFDTYKKARFKEVENNLSRLDTVVNVKEYVQKFYDALKKDVVDMTTNLDTLIQNKPSCPSDYWCSRQDLADLIGYKYSSEVRRSLYYALKDKTNDFLDDIYKDSWQQDVSNLEVSK